MDRTHAEARAGIPMTAQQVLVVIGAMERDTKSKAARKRMAEVAVQRANVTDEGRDVWRKYLSTFA